MKDFTEEGTTEPRGFKINDDVFLAARVCPGGLLADLAKINNAPTDADKLDGVMDFMDQVLLPDSADRFTERLRSPEEPISFPQAMKVFEYLVEEYTQETVPTEGSSSSQSGPAEKTTARTSTRRAAKSSTRRVPVSDD